MGYCSVQVTQDVMVVLCLRFDVMREYLEIFITFSRVGFLTFGGGYTMLPILQKEVVDNHQWVSEKQMIDYYAISQCTPGIIAVNTAIFIGYQRKKIGGAIASALGIAFPSIVIILLIASIFQTLTEYQIVQRALVGVNIAVAVLVINTTIKMFKIGVVDFITLIIFIMTFALMIFYKVNPILVVVSSAIFGIMIKKGGKQ